MLPTKVAIFTPASLGGGQYTFNLYFQAAGKAAYLSVGDYVKDTLGNEYAISTWSNSPSDHSSGQQVTVSFVTTDILPTADTGFDSDFFTPGQVDLRPVVRTGGSISNISTYSGQNYEYQLTGIWDDNSEALLAEIGDSIVDSTGKEFQITFLETNKFSSSVRVTEKIKEAIPPAAGQASLYRSTQNYDLFQGTELTDPARTLIRNRDDFNIDKKLAELESAISTNAGESILTNYTNGTGASIPALTATMTNSFGYLDILDVSNESSVKAFKGITSETIANSALGSVVISGLIKNISTLLANQASVFVAKDGSLTSTPPEIGVNGFLEGDFVVYVGHISRNEANPAQKDLNVNIQIVGQL